MPFSPGGCGVRFAKRLDQVPPYLFAELERKIAEKRRAGVDVISLGIGDPDLPTPQVVVDALAEAARDPGTHQYPTNHGSDEFRQAGADFYRERFGVELDPASEIVPALGGKEAVGHIAMALLDPGDVCLSPDPGYPPYTSGPLFSGADVHYLPLRAESGFLPDLESIPTDVLARANLLFLDYPNNPTGAVVEPGYFERAVELARANDLVVVHDNAYSELCYDGYLAPSFLETPGAKDVGVEFHSLSKTYNMTGWRLGFAVGHKEVLAGLGKVKSNLDSGVFEAVQAAGITALGLDDAVTNTIRNTYQERRDTLIPGLKQLALEVDAPPAAFYVWVAVPKGYTSASFTAHLLEKAGIVTTPGNGFGAPGEGYIRMTVCTSKDRLAEAVERIKKAGF